MRASKKQMRNDEKERAEHVMLVDLGRNDLGRVSEYGSVKVKDLMYVERYSHVMHLVSALEGTLRKDLDALDAFAACFPAGTLSGAPKVRAMQIIEELEPTRRGDLRRIGFVRGLRRKSGFVHWHTNDVDAGEESVSAGGCRHCGRFRSGYGVSGVDEQGAGFVAGCGYCQEQELGLTTWGCGDSQLQEIRD